MIGDDAVNHGEPEPRSHADLLGREEGLEDPIQGRRVHAVTAVAHGQTNIATGGKSAVRQHLFGVERDQVERDVDDAMPGHGLRGIGAEVHDHLLQPPRLAQHDGIPVRGILVRQTQAKVDRRRQGRPQQAGRLLEQGAHAQRTKPLLGAAAEGKDAVDDVPRALARLLHLLHMLPFPAVPAQPGQQHLGIAENGAEDVVEVMRDASGQRAERLHALGMPQARFERLPFPLAPLAEQRIHQDLADRSQQRDVVFRPALLAHDGIEAQEADAVSGVPQRNAEPGANPALRQPRLRFAGRQCRNGGDVDAAITLIPLELHVIAPLRCGGNSHRSPARRPASHRAHRFLRETNCSIVASVA